MRKLGPNTTNLTLQGLAGIILVFLSVFINQNPHRINKSRIYIYILILAGFSLLLIAILSIFKKKILIEQEKIQVFYLVHKSEILLSKIKKIEKIDLGKEKYPPFQKRYKYEIIMEDGNYKLSSDEFANLDALVEEIKYRIKENKLKSS